MKWSLVWLAVAAISMSRSAQTPTITRLDGTPISTAEIDATMTRPLKAAEVTGAAIAVIDHGKIAYQAASGFRDQERNLPFGVDSVMSAASITKPAFAYLVMELVDEGLLDLDKPVYQYLPKPLPEYQKYADLADDPRYKRITTRMLLSHTAGFPNWRWLEEDRKLRIHLRARVEICLFRRRHRPAATDCRDRHPAAAGRLNAGEGLPALRHDADEHGVAGEIG
jgi:CubicO group peptidase (beta-lactamase class C family)